MTKFAKIAIALIMIVGIFILGWLIYNDYIRHFNQLTNKTPVKQIKTAGQYYMDGCDNLNFIGLHRNLSKSDEKAIAEFEKHNSVAENDFSKAIELMPDCANAYWKRGRCRYNRWRWYGNPEYNFAAIADYKKAIELAPASIEVHHSLLRAYSNSGASELAKQELVTIIKLDPDWHIRKDILNQGQKQGDFL